MIDRNQPKREQWIDRIAYGYAVAIALYLFGMALTV